MVSRRTVVKGSRGFRFIGTCAVPVSRAPDRINYFSLGRLRTDSCSLPAEADGACRRAGRPR